MKLRDSAIALLERVNAEEDADGSIWFGRHTPANPEPRLAIRLKRRAPDGSVWLDVWGTVKGKHTKGLNIRWVGRTVELVSFRPGEWVDGCWP